MKEIVSAWGDNTNGQLSNGTTAGQAETPQQVKGLEGVRTVEGGSGHVIAIMEDGSAYGWGRNGFGQIGDCSTDQQTEPTRVKLDGIKAVAPGGGHTLYLLEDGSVWGCGAGFFGMLGPDNMRVHPVPVRIEAPTNIVQLASGGSHALALLDDGTVWAWGRDDCGQLADGDQTGKRPGSLVQVHAGREYPIRALPAQVEGISEATFVATGGGHSLVVHEDGSLTTWGLNDCGQLGDGATTDRKREYRTPVKAKVSGVREVAGAYHHTLILLQDGTVRACGINDRGQCGDGTTIERATPVEVVGLTDATQVVATGGGGDDNPGDAGHSLAVRADGTVWGWGNNDFGELGLGHTELQTKATQVPGLTGVRQLTVSGEVPGFRELPGGGSTIAIHAEK
ncbi:MAG TPA: hypothetical protein VHH15_13980 [Actinophytocola sp.]|nr:hypothetical protein [Actinophytocola sp.]